MDGDEVVKCYECLGEIKDEECYECDCCQGRVHRQCVTLSSSELRVIPLQKRMMLFVCEKCKKLMTKIPYMVRMLETISEEFADLRAAMERSKKSEMETLQRTINDVISKNVELANRIITLEAAQSSTPRTDFLSYADITSGQGSKQRKNVPSLIIKPKVQQNSDETREDLCKNIKPAGLKIGVKNLRVTKNGGVVVKCQTKEDVEKLRREAEKTLDGKYEVHVSRLRKPRIKIIGGEMAMSERQIEEGLREQNDFIAENDEIKVTYIRKHRNNKTTTIYAECNPELFHKFIRSKRVFLQWERYPVYEDINIPRCFKCQDFYHRSDGCNRRAVCEYCMGEHNIRECPKSEKKCANCVAANQRYRTNYDIHHEANNQECPSYKYLIDVLRSKIDYGQQF